MNNLVKKTEKLKILQLRNVNIEQINETSVRLTWKVYKEGADNEELSINDISWKPTNKKQTKKASTKGALSDLFNSKSFLIINSLKY